LTRLVLLALLLLPMPLLAQQGQLPDANLDRFKRAWQAAAKGDRAAFEQYKAGMDDYVLYPYLQYEDFRFRRASVDPAEMARFLEAHSDWAFAAGLRRSWLRTLGQQGRWDDLLRYAPGEQDTEIQCYLAQARIQKGDTESTLEQAQALWTVGQSQPKACDPVFLWLRKARGITPTLAWQRISLAIAARNPRLTLYLARFVPAQERIWVDRWQQQELQRYNRLDQARQWPDQEKARAITAFGLKYLARSDADRAWRLFELLDAKIRWAADQRNDILRTIALRSALVSAPDAAKRLHAVPESARDDQLLEGWARYGLATGNWAEVVIAVTAMSDELKNSARWRYWDARAHLNTGDSDHAREVLASLAEEANYYGFLAADYLGRPYSICPGEPTVGHAALQRFSERPAFRRVVALSAAGLNNWSRREWQLATKSLSRDELRLAAALATEHNWHDLAILSLADSGDRNWYEWRFPLAFAALIMEQANKNGLDPAWVMGLIRSESAMSEDAISAADARGLMQVMPGTAAQVAHRHGYTYTGSEQLLHAKDNIVFGTAFLRELMDRFDQNPVLALGAYNAGPSAVKHWLDTLLTRDPAIWIENLPYSETREYIPRVLAFTTIYNWRLRQPVRRITARMPMMDSGNMGAQSAGAGTAEVICTEPAADSMSGS